MKLLSEKQRRALLAAAFLLSTSVPSFATCSTARLAGSWTFTRDHVAPKALICNFTFNNQGRSSISYCTSYANGHEDSHQELQLKLNVGADCLLIGRLYDLTNTPNNWLITGRTDVQVNNVVGKLQGAGGFTMTRY